MGGKGKDSSKKSTSDEKGKFCRINLFIPGPGMLVSSASERRDGRITAAYISEVISGGSEFARSFSVR